MGNCSNCIYARYPKIPASVPKRARIAIVGEAPGPVEIARKRPFVGPSGNLIRKAFNMVGLPETEEIFITNALLCRPPSGKPISKEAVERCRPRLLEELSRVRPEIIIAFGNTSMHALTGDYKKKITKEQGRVLEKSLLDFECKIIPVFHPVTILRDGSKFPRFMQALRRVADAIQGRPLDPPPKPSYSVVTTLADIERAIRGLVKQPYLAADIETSGDQISGRILCLAICWKPGKVLIFPEEVVPYLGELYEHPGPKWVWQGGKYDTGFLVPRGMNVRLDEDTMLLHYCLNENPGTHDLEQLVIQLLGDQPHKHMVDQYVKGNKKYGYANVPKEVLYDYLALDVDRTYRIFQILYPQVMANPDLKRLYYTLLLPASRFLREVGYKGLRPNPERLKKESDRLIGEMQEMLKKIQEVAELYWDPVAYVEETGARTVPKLFNPSSVKQLAWLLYDRLKLRPKKRKGTGGRSTDEEVLKQLADQHEIVELILDFRSVRKAYGTYVKGVAERIAADGRVHPTFNVHGTVTGRLSCTDPNVQNVPKEMRVVYYAEPGYVFVEADYKGAELRVLAYISGDAFMREVFQQGRDLHTEVQNALGIERIKAKTINFGIPYGRTPESIAQEFNMPIEEARKMVQDWFKRAPDVERYLLECDRAAETGQVLTTPFGRHRRFGLISAENVEDLKKEARNFRIQSIASDLTLTSAITMHEELKRMGAHIVNLVHDSLLVECPADKWFDACKLIIDTMERVPRETIRSEIPFEVDVKVGECWGELWKVAIFPHNQEVVQLLEAQKYDELKLEVKNAIEWWYNDTTNEIVVKYK